MDNSKNFQFEKFEKLSISKSIEFQKFFNSEK